MINMTHQNAQQYLQIHHALAEAQPGMVWTLGVSKHHENFVATARWHHSFIQELPVLVLLIGVEKPGTNSVEEPGPLLRVSPNGAAQGTLNIQAGWPRNNGQYVKIPLEEAMERINRSLNLLRQCLSRTPEAFPESIVTIFGNQLHVLSRYKGEGTPSYRNLNLHLVQENNVWNLYHNGVFQKTWNTFDAAHKALRVPNPIEPPASV